MSVFQNAQGFFPLFEGFFSKLTQSFNELVKVTGWLDIFCIQPLEKGMGPWLLKFALTWCWNFPVTQMKNQKDKWRTDNNTTKV